MSSFLFQNLCRLEMAREILLRKAKGDSFGVESDSVLREAILI